MTRCATVYVGLEIGERINVSADLKIAVVITCFNYENFVGGAIRSVISQSSNALELVVIDDGSTDNSWKIIQETGARAFRTSNSGQLAAAIYGLSRTRAPFVLFLDADDELLPGAIDRIVENLDSDVAKLQFCLTCVDAEGAVIADPYPALERFRSQNKVTGEILRTGVYQTPPTSGNVFRRDVCKILNECGYDRALDGVILFVAPFFGDVVSLSESLGVYRIHGQNDSGLGRGPQAATFERDLRRFQLRMAHLRRLVSEVQPGANLVDPEKTYYFQFLVFCVSILRKKRLSIRSFIHLARASFREPRSARWKAVNALFFAAIFLAPMRLAQMLLVFRFSIGRRSPRELLRIAVGSEKLLRSRSATGREGDRG